MSSVGQAQSLVFLSGFTLDQWHVHLGLSGQARKHRYNYKETEGLSPLLPWTTAPTPGDTSSA